MRLRTLLVGALLAGMLAPAGASASPATRLYLLESSGRDGYWSVDPTDPELSAATLYRTCGNARPPGEIDTCGQYLDAVSGMHEFTVTFAPAAHLVDLGGTQPDHVRFRFRLDVDAAAAPFTVHGVITEDLDDTVSAAATEVSPGVWEGTVADKTPLRGTYNTLGLKIRTAAPGVSLTLGAAGQSWFELAQPIDARGVPELRAADAAPSVATYQGAGRTLWFSDDRWSAASFTGDLTQARIFTFDLAEPATSVIAWVETYDTPLLFDVASGRDPDPREYENSPGLRLSQGGVLLAVGTNGGITGRGQDAVAALDVAPGELQLEVSPSSWDPDQSGQELPYELQVVAVHGDRTLQSMRWRFSTGDSSRLPLVAACPYGLEPVPVPSTVASFMVDLDWTTFAQPMPDFTLNYDLPTYGLLPCGELNASDRVRFTLPPASAVWMLGPTGTRHSTYVSWQDTVFEMQVDYTYLPPAP
jgi:hypothetical protein